jgi:hypothetical protein
MKLFHYHLPHCHQSSGTPYLWAESDGSKVAAGGSKTTKSQKNDAKKQRKSTKKMAKTEFHIRQAESFSREENNIFRLRKRTSRAETDSTKAVLSGDIYLFVISQRVFSLFR